MSAIDFELSVDRVSDPKGDRKVTFNGKLSPAPGRPTALSESRMGVQMLPTARRRPAVC